MVALRFEKLLSSANQVSFKASVWFVYLWHQVLCLALNVKFSNILMFSCIDLIKMLVWARASTPFNLVSTTPLSDKWFRRKWQKCVTYNDFLNADESCTFRHWFEKIIFWFIELLILFLFNLMIEACDCFTGSVLIRQLNKTKNVAQTKLYLNKYLYRSNSPFSKNISLKTTTFYWFAW